MTNRNNNTMGDVNDDNDVMDIQNDNDNDGDNNKIFHQVKETNGVKPVKPLGEEQKEDHKQMVGKQISRHEEEQKGIPVDSSFSWVICFACLTMQCLVFGHIRSMVTLFVDIREEFATTQTVMSTTLSIFSLCIAISSVVSSNLILPVAPWRILSFCAACLDCLAVLVAAHSPNIPLWMLCYAIRGLSCGAINMVNASMIGFYFKERRAFAFSIYSLGFVIANITFPLMANAFRNAFGLRGALLLMGGLELHMIPLSMCLRPHTFYTRHLKPEEDNSAVNITTTPSAATNHNNSNNRNTLIKVNGSTLTEEGKPLIERTKNSETETRNEDNRHTPDIVLSSSVPTDSILHSQVDSFSDIQLECRMCSPHQNELPENDHKYYNRDINDKNRYLCNKHAAEIDDNNVDEDRTKLVVSPSSSNSNNEKSRSKNLLKASSIGDFIEMGIVKASGMGAIGGEGGSEEGIGSRALSVSSAHYSTGIGSLLELPVMMYDNDVDDDNDEDIKEGADGNDNNDKKKENGDLEKGPKDGQPPSSKKRKSLREIFDPTIFKSLKFRQLFVANSLSMLVIFTAMYIPVIAHKINLSKQNGSLLLTIGGCVDFLARPIVGWLADKNWIAKEKMIGFSLLVVALACQFGPFYNNFADLFVYTIMASMFAGCRANLAPPLMFSYFGPRMAPKLMGWNMMGGTFFLAINHPIFGALVDYTGSFTASLHYIGAVLAVSGVIMLLHPVIDRMEDNRVKKLEAGGIHE